MDKNERIKNLTRELAILKQTYKVACFDLDILHQIMFFLVDDYFQLYNEFDALRLELKSIKKTDIKLSVPLDKILDKSIKDDCTQFVSILNHYKDMAYHDYFDSRVTSN